MTKILTALALVSSLAFAACTHAPADEVKAADPNATAATASTIDATVTRIIHLPDGKVVGLGLSTGVAVHFPPHAATDAMSAVKVGDAVHVEADKDPRQDGLFARSISRDGQALLAAPSHDARPGEAGQKARRGRGMRGDARAMRGAPKDGPAREHGAGKGRYQDLAALTKGGKVTAVEADRGGRARTLTLEDGTTAYLPPFGAASVQVGDKVVLTGRGGDYAGGAALVVEKLKVGDAAEIDLAPPKPAEKTRREGTVERVLPGPRGDAGGFLLDDGTVVVTGPTKDAPVQPGTKVALEGRVMGGAFFASDLSADGKAIDLRALRPERPQHAAGERGHGRLDHDDAARARRGEREADLRDLTRTSTIRALVTGPDGAPHRIILADGTSIQLRRSAHAPDAAALTVGKAVTVRGKGVEGKYGASIFAHSLTVDGKELLEMKPEAPRDR